MIKLKEKINNMIAFRTEHCINTYKFETQEEREMMKYTIKSSLYNFRPLVGPSFVNMRYISLSLYLATLTLLSFYISLISNTTLTEKVAIFSIVFFISIIPSIIFERLQCKFLLSVFKNIDEEESIKDSQ